MIQLIWSSTPTAFHTSVYRLFLIFKCPSGLYLGQHRTYLLGTARRQSGMKGPFREQPTMCHKYVCSKGGRLNCLLESLYV